MKKYRDYLFEANTPVKSPKENVIGALTAAKNYIEDLVKNAKISWWGSEVKIKPDSLLGLGRILDSAIQEINNIKEEKEISDEEYQRIQKWFNVWKKVREGQRSKPPTPTAPPEQETPQITPEEEPETTSAEEPPLSEPEEGGGIQVTRPPKAPSKEDLEMPDLNDEISPGSMEYKYIIGMALPETAKHFNKNRSEVTIDDVYAFLNYLESLGTTWRTYLPDDGDITKFPHYERAVRRGDRLLKASKGTIPGTLPEITIKTLVDEGNARRIRGRIDKTNNFGAIDQEVMLALKEKDEEIFNKAFDEVNPKRGPWGKESLKNLVTKFFELLQTNEGYIHPARKTFREYHQNPVLLVINKSKRIKNLDEKLKFLKSKLSR